MDIKDFKFPVLNGVDVAFSTLNTDPELLKEAKERGFYNGSTKYNRLFSKLFFEGGSLHYKETISPEFKQSAGSYLRAFMGSFSPKHEEKDAICALLLSELVDINKY